MRVLIVWVVRVALHATMSHDPILAGTFRRTANEREPNKRVESDSLRRRSPLTRSVGRQDRSVALYKKLAREAAIEERTLFDDFLKYARQHRDVVARFGRFPHRNAMLGRPSTDDELEFLKRPGSRF